MTAVLQLQALTKRYGTLTAVEDLSLDVLDGEVFGLLGPNGAGKTTLINMMCGLLKPDAGRVLVRGKAIRGGDASVRRRVGMCPQDIVVWKDLTCLEQMQFLGQMYGLRAATARANSVRLLRDLDLLERRDHLARTLSGGMQRRLNLAMALVHDPEIVVLDEAEAGLDPQSRVLVREYIRSLARHKTILITTHNMDEAERVADRVAIMDHGKLLTVDTPEALKHTVGEGDVLEIEIRQGEVEAARQAVAAVTPQATAADHTLIIRARGVVDCLPRILEALHQIDVQPGEIRVRPNSLEDVFLALTGRRLRE